MSTWKLVEVAPLATPLPGVVEMRQVWAGRWVQYRVGRPGSDKWRRGKVQRIDNDGVVHLVEVRNKKLVAIAAFDMRHIPVLLRGAK